MATLALPSPSSHLLHKDPPQPKISLPANQLHIGDLQERKVCDEIDDAIWEATASPSPRIKSGVELNKVKHDAPEPDKHMNSDNDDRMLLDGDAFQELRRRARETRHRSLNLDIHINEPNLVFLQDSTLVSKHLSGPLVEPNFLFQPKTSDTPMQQSSSSSQRIIKMVPSSSKSSPMKHPTSPNGFRLSSLDLKVDEGDEEQGNLRSESTRKLIDHGMEVKLHLPEGPIPKKGSEEVRLRVASSAVASPNSRKPSMSKQRTVTMSKELVKVRTKSRLVEVSFRHSPGAASSEAMSASYDTAKKLVPASPARPSVRKVMDTVEADEEDPFKDIDVQDSFRHGNFKAITIAQWVAFVVLMGSLVCSLTVDKIMGRQLWGLDLWKWFLLVLVVLCGRLVSGWLIRILVIILEKNFLLRKKVLYFVYGLRRGVQNCLWLGLAVLAWKLMFDPHVESSTSNHKALWLITRLLECFLIAAFIWLAKLLLVKSLASSFHVATFFDRIQESLYNQHVLEQLLGPPLLDLSFEPLQKPADVSSPIGVSMARGLKASKKVDELINHEDLQKASSKNVSPGVMKQLMNLVKHPGIKTLVTTFDENVGMHDDDAEEMEINSELEAKAVAKRIFKNVAQEESRHIEKEDLVRFVPLEDIPNVLNLFEGAKDTGSITKKALKNWVVNVYQDRKAIAHSLNDTKTAVKELHRMSSVVVVIIIIVVWLLVLRIATMQVLLFVTSQLLLVGFIFSNTLKQVFEAIIFLFVMHPFDVGDRCIIDGVQLVVEEMKILSTVFLKPDNEKLFYPNSVLATKPISNLYRSPDQKEVLDFSVHISMTTEKMHALKEKITAYVEKKSEHWGPKFGFYVKELEDLNRMRISVVMQHTINFQKVVDRLNRRSELLLELKRVFAELGIEYRLLTQQVQLSYDSFLPQVMADQYPVPTVTTRSSYAQQGQLI